MDTDWPYLARTRKSCMIASDQQRKWNGIPRGAETVMMIFQQTQQHTFLLVLAALCISKTKHANPVSLQKIFFARKSFSTVTKLIAVMTPNETNTLIAAKI